MSTADQMRVAIGRSFRSHRRRLELSQDAVAARCGLHSNQIRRLELAETDVQLSTVIKAAEGLGVPLDEIIRDAHATLGRADRH